MKRTAGLLTILAGLAFAPGASSEVIASQSNATATAVSASFGSPTNTLVIDANKADESQADSTGTGTLHVSGTDAKGPHSYDGTIECFSPTFLSSDAGVLARVSNPVGEPAVLYGVLVHLTDPEDLASGENGVGDKLDITNLNQAQYNRQKTAGCAGAPARTALTAGNITIVFGFSISLPPCFPFCP